ncbi:MAG: arsenite efflux transporter metallochaperone ArsD [Cryobacterium sp.]
MTDIQIFEPGLCCGTGVCGVDVDQSLVTVSADLNWLRAEGGVAARFNLAQEPIAFAENEIARSFLITAGQAGLPITLVDGATVLTGRYPNRVELASWAGLGRPALLAAAAAVDAAVAVAVAAADVNAAAPAVSAAGEPGGEISVAAEAESHRQAVQPDASPRLLMMSSAPDTDEGASCGVGGGCC